MQTVWQFIDRINIWIWQGTGTDMYDTEHILFTLNNMLLYIYSYKDWSWTIVKESITSTGASEFTMSNRIFKPYYVDLDWNKFTRTNLPIFFEDEVWKLYYVKSNKIYTWETWDTLRAIYHKSAPKYTNADTNVEIDLPDEFAPVLYHLAMWQLYPFNLENWVSLANSFFTSAKELMDKFAIIYGFNIKPENISWSSIYN